MQQSTQPDLPPPLPPLPRSASSQSSSDSSASPTRPPVTPRVQSAPHPHRRRRRNRRRRSSMTHALNDPNDSAIDSNNPLTTDKRASFYRHNNISDTSIESSTLLDHRTQQSMRPRRGSILGSLGATSTGGLPSTFARTTTAPANAGPAMRRRRTDGSGRRNAGSASDGDSHDENDETPLLGGNREDDMNERSSLLGAKSKNSRPSTGDPRGIRNMLEPPTSFGYGSVNFPPSMPTSPRIDPRIQVTDGGLDYDLRGLREGNDAIINIHENPAEDTVYPSSPPTPFPQEPGGPPLHRPSHAPEEDVCFPVDDVLTDDDAPTLNGKSTRRRRRAREWPELSVLEEWSRDEKEERSEGIRTKKLPEPVLVGGRLRPAVRTPWHKDELDAPYRFTYFNEDLPATIHSQTISELLQPGQSFTDLFRPEPAPLEESSDDEDSQPEEHIPERTESRATDNKEEGHHTPPEPSQSLPRIGNRPTFWLDVLNPTDAEMKVLGKAFGIHPLTVEDILMQETREKVELFRSYYLVSYRTFEQDLTSDDYLEPVNIYVVVFRDGVISFHFAMTPHPANVRRRIRQLKDYITVSADWISYALIDDITDAFAPLIHNLEKEVDDIDDAILRMHVVPGSDSSSSPSNTEKKNNSNHSIFSDNEGQEPEQKSDGDMLKRVGDARRKVMGLYRLMGNKADVVKGFAKRCTEQWEVAPRSEIGLYLGDIQDHIITMVSNLNHMEKILSRSHSNYLAQINIKMNERQEQTADVLGRLTVLGTIVLPMNIITGLWGMNVMVPGQEIENLNWFYCITAGLVVFGFLCYYIAKRVYKIM